ncbi:MAG: D-alanyl-D-alanine carboxypeptidase [Clostridia bacterium]|nr:D-alanyl-D-alanine carboxypeptidase [Clostridia bacterium]
MKKILMILSLLFLISFSYAATPNFDVYSNTAILIDAKSGNVLFEKNANQKAYPASTTKTLTALIALEKISDLEEEIIPSHQAVFSVPTGSSIAYFSENEKLTAEQVLYGLMLPSGNDAANILAEHISGSNAEFAKLMNETAKRLGAENSNFVNPSGLHDDMHYTTAADMAKIAFSAMQNPRFREIVSRSEYTVPPTNVSSKSRTFRTTNKLLTPGEYYLEYATGIKTGYTTQAANCLIASASKDGVDLISVVLGGNNIPVGKSAVYTDTLNLFQFGFNNYFNKVLIEKDTFVKTITPKKAGKTELNLITENEINITLENGDTSIFEENITLNDNIVAPIKKGDVLGTISYSKDGTVIGYSNLLADKDIAKEPWYSVLGRILATILLGLLSLVVCVILLGVILRIYNEIRKRIKRRRKGNR